MADFYVRVAGKVHGPLDSAKIKQLATSGKINEATEISQTANGPFVPAAKVKGLFAARANPSVQTAPRVVPAAVPVSVPVSAPMGSAAGVVPLSDAVDAVKDIGGYIGKTLLPGEQLVYQGRLHWFLFLRPVCWLVFAILVTVTGHFGGEDPSIGKSSGVFAVLLAIAIVSLVSRVLTYLTSEFAVTNKRVVMKQGFIRRKTMELMLNKVDSLGIDQGLLGRAFNFGTVRVAVATEKQSFKFLANPLEFRRHVQLMQTKTQST